MVFFSSVTSARRERCPFLSPSNTRLLFTVTESCCCVAVWIGIVGSLVAFFAQFQDTWVVEADLTPRLR